MKEKKLFPMQSNTLYFPEITSNQDANFNYDIPFLLWFPQFASFKKKGGGLERQLGARALTYHVQGHGFDP